MLRERATKALFNIHALRLQEFEKTTGKVSAQSKEAFRAALVGACRAARWLRHSLHRTCWTGRAPMQLVDRREVLQVVVVLGAHMADTAALGRSTSQALLVFAH